MKKYRKGILSLVLVLLVLSACVPVLHAGSGNDKSFLWEVRSEESMVYLLGSIHFMKKDAYPLSETVRNAFEKADILVVEANIDDVSKTDVQTLLETAFYTGNDSLQNHVSGETYELVKKKFERFGIPPLILDRQKPWILALTLESLELAGLGYTPEYGIDMHFLTLASGKKKIRELESIDYQIALLSGFSDRDQEALLLYTMKNLESFGKEVDGLVIAWRSGDAERMESLIIKSIPDDQRLAAIYEKIIFERNTSMTARIEDFLRTKESYFVIVGAGHLVGSRGIIERLKQKGYRVTQR